MHYDNYNLHCVISIHALLAESDRNGLAMRWNTCISIHALLAESDAVILCITKQCRDFYPRSPCGERPANNRTEQQAQRISIHALLAESDPEKSESLTTYFISIHALLAESDRALRQLQFALRYFYPRSPCGERHCDFSQKRHPLTISIHALLAESDCPLFFSCWLLAYFYPRSPCGERPTNRIFCAKLSPISIHALLAESDA